MVSVLTLLKVMRFAHHITGQSEVDIKQFCDEIVYYEFIVKLVNRKRETYWKRELKDYLKRFGGEDRYVIFHFTNGFRFGFENMPTEPPDDALKTLYRKIATELVIKRGFVPSVQDDDTAVFQQVVDDVWDEKLTDDPPDAGRAGDDDGSDEQSAVDDESDDDSDDGPDEESDDGPDEESDDST